REFFEPRRDEAELFFQLACGAVFGSLTFRECSGRDFQEVTHCGMSILFDECYRAVVEHGNDYGAAVVMDHFALIREFTFTDCVDSDVEDPTVEHLLAAQYLW